MNLRALDMICTKRTLELMPWCRVFKGLYQINICRSAVLTSVSGADLSMGNNFTIGRLLTKRSRYMIGNFL